VPLPCPHPCNVYSHGRYAIATDLTYNNKKFFSGQKFGLVQAKLLTASIVHKFKILKTEKTSAKLSFAPATFLTIPNEQLWVKFEARK
jgi:hypothetical protein